MRNWFTVTEVFDGIFQVTEPRVDPFIRGNIWWIPGHNRDLVFDTGNGIGTLQQEIPELFRNDPFVAVSHAHPDHRGGAHEFERIHCHELERPLIENTYEGFLDTAEFARQLNLAPSEISSEESLIRPGDANITDLHNYSIKAPNAVHEVKDGDEVAVGGRNFTVLHTPGHTAGSIVLYDEKSRLLLSGDLLYDGTLLDHCTGANPADYRKSLERIRELDVDWVLPGHGAPIDPVRFHELIDNYLHAHEKAL